MSTEPPTVGRIMPSDVTLVLVHGAWHGPWCWDLLGAELTRPDDPAVVAVALPSTSSDVSALPTSRDGDVAVIRRAVVDAGGPVVVLGHSAAGNAVSEALGELPNVVGVVYLCAFMLDEGESSFDLYESVPDWWTVHPDEGYIEALGPAERFYDDVPPRLRDWALSRLRHQALTPQPLRSAAWRTVPSAYVVCDHDRALEPELQLRMARRAGTVAHLPTGHSPFLSDPPALATLLRTLIAGFVPPPDRARDQQGAMSVIYGQWMSQMAGTLAALDVPELLAEAPRSGPELATAAGTDPDATFRLMRAAVSIGLAAYDAATDRFASTGLLDRFRADAPDSLRGLLLVSTGALWPTTGLFADAVRTGSDQARAAHGMTFWEYFAAHPDQGALFTQAMQGLSEPTIREAVAVTTVAPGSLVADLGGASGSFVLSLLEHHPLARGVVVDLPHVVGHARGEIERRGLGDRATVVEGSFFDPLPAADLYLLKYILHDWDDAACEKLLRRCRESMRPGGQVLVVDLVVGETADPGPAALFDVVMLTTLPGREHSLADLDRFFTSAGLIRSRTTELSGGYYGIEAVADDAGATG